MVMNPEPPGCRDTVVSLTAPELGDTLSLTVRPAFLPQSSRETEACRCARETSSDQQADAIRPRE